MWTFGGGGDCNKSCFLKSDLSLNVPWKCSIIKSEFILGWKYSDCDSRPRRFHWLLNKWLMDAVSQWKKKKKCNWSCLAQKRSPSLSLITTKVMASLQKKCRRRLRLKSWSQDTRPSGRPWFFYHTHTHSSWCYWLENKTTMSCVWNFFNVPKIKTNFFTLKCDLLSFFVLIIVYSINFPTFLHSLCTVIFKKYIYFYYFIFLFLISYYGLLILLFYY